MVKAASHDHLKKAFQDHLAQSQTHVERLDIIFTNLGVSPADVTAPLKIP
jgi:ferritin-like metal-binding protein YciE